MKAVLWTLLGTVAGFLLAFLLVIAVEAYSNVVHPLPTGFDGSMKEMCEHVMRYPTWVLATVVPLWGIIGFAGTWVARRSGTAYASGIVGALLVFFLVLNVAMVPYPIWFKFVILIAVPAAILFGHRSAAKPIPAT